MKILFFDTETTGLPKNWKAPVHQLDNWPRLVQIAWQVYSSNGDLLEEHDYVIKPDGFIISSEASAVHKITTEKALETGLDLLTILKVFSSSVKSCGLMVAHNYSYDYNIMGSELLRNGLENSLKDKENICTMKASTEFCKIPGPYGYKWPKLEELYDILFRESFNAHNALDDIKATARCFWALRDKKIIDLISKNNPKDKILNNKKSEDNIVSNILDINKFQSDSVIFEKYLEINGCTKQSTLDAFFDSIESMKDDPEKIAEIEKIFGKSIIEFSKSKDDQVLFLLKEIKKNNYNFVLDETTVGVLDEQVINTLHIRSNNYFRTNPDNIVFNSPATFFSSTFNSVIVGFDFFENRFHRYYDRNKNNCVAFLNVKRADILGFQEIKNTQFKTIKTSKSALFKNRVKNAMGPVGLILDVASDFIIRVEDNVKNLKDSKGSLFILQFLENKIKVELEICCEDWYSPIFRKFLEDHWKKDISSEFLTKFFKDAADSEGGCYIATMAYGDYNHENVITLRKFRDKILNKYFFGRIFIKVYYKLSPKLVALLKGNVRINSYIRKTLNLFVKILS